MLQAKLEKDGFHLIDVQIPEPGPNEVVVKTIACGVCGGDQHTYSVRENVTPEFEFLGHEGTGTIVALGDGVENFEIGDMVTSLSGAFAEYFVSPVEHVYRVPENVDPLHALGEPVACCVHASQRFNIQKGDRVAVVGCGFMGLICMQLAKLAEPSEVLAIDPVAYRRAKAIELGADHAIDPQAIDLFDPDEGLYDVVIEAGGVPSALELSTDLVNHHGRVILIGYHESHDGQRQVNMKRWNYKAIDVINGHVRRMDEKYEAMVKGVELIAQGKLDTAALVHTYPLTDISTAFDRIFSPEDELFKVVLVTDDP
ncbi:MAG: zinc-binding dehydrogenase, partial [Parvularculaceae bacterium]|nr:zinc-binding dehydrogenase [Parvularculaceae bacterium]